MDTMRPLLILAITTTLSLTAGAEVIRCADAAGNVSYTDGACSPGARPVGRVSVPEPTRPPPDGAYLQPPAPPRDASEASLRPVPGPSGPAIIDSRGSNGDDRTSDSRWNSDRGDDPAIFDYGYPYPYGAAYGQPQRPRDMRPRIRNCDAQGCQDKQGNHYNRSGQLDRYQSVDGKTCQPIGTTTVCR
ncbi:hypothetical protein [Variovorax sp. GT1P44]|uniref:DUF4124 domain-containing protein n=1 Tax=Variovorax sp. GT1P44 TaxID=3443742 RepID=UPI003F4811D6